MKLDKQRALAALLLAQTQKASKPDPGLLPSMPSTSGFCDTLNYTGRTADRIRNTLREANTSETGQPELPYRKSPWELHYDAQRVADQRDKERKERASRERQHREDCIRAAQLRDEHDAREREAERERQRSEITQLLLLNSDRSEIRAITKDATPAQILECSRRAAGSTLPFVWAALLQEIQKGEHGTKT
jgi:hypothetical protein